jgi:acetaldehyde dehydrogenase (acetylating)
LKRQVFIIAALVICIIGFLVWWNYRMLPGIEPQSDGSERVALIGLWTGIVGLLAAMVGLLTNIVQLVKTRR